MTDTPCESADVKRIPGAVENARRSRHHEPRSKRRGILFPHGGIDERGQPSRFRECIRVQQCDELAVIELLYRAVVGDRKADIVGKRQAFDRDAQPGAHFVDNGRTDVCAAAVSDDNPIGLSCLS